MELSIIIVNYNGGELVNPCLHSLFENPPQGEFEVVFVDNASTDGSFEAVKAAFPTVRFVAKDINQGLAKSFNEGLLLSRGRYILSLDNDTCVLPGALDAMLTFMDAHADVGAVGSLLLNPDLTPQKTLRRKPSAINAIFGRRSLITRIWPSNPLSHRYLMDDLSNTDQPFDVHWVSTAALMVRREAVDAVGGLDEDFFVYWVDADWCARLRDGQWRIVAVPAARIIHDENLKAKRRSRRNVRMVIDFHRGAYLYYRKNHARSLLNPMALVALAGLSIRAVTLIVYDYLRWVVMSQTEGARR
ncbi:MAG: glycosyltransferase family 2 protein [Gammaproteobacteria bacterium]|nr:glycosyltransferase family 2 protein [Gammaproteobacteria bacterium]